MLTLPVLSYGKIIKGGPGSGNHGHEGIPGHQGGSKPKGLTTLAVSDPVPLSFENTAHPLVRLFAGNLPEIAPDGKLKVSASMQAIDKTMVAARLSETLGITKQHANGFLKIWANSSNDHSLQSLGIQQAASNEFDTFLTYWQQDRLKETLADAKAAFVKGFEKRVGAGMDGGKAAFETINGLKAEYVYPFQIKATRELVEAGESPKTVEEALDLFDRAGNMGIHTTQQALRTMQEDTAALLQARGINSIRAYRGFQMDKEPPAYWAPGSAVNVRNNALSSWTIDKDLAEQYSNVKNGVLLEAEIPADRVIALPSTGLGNAAQWEVVMVGHPQRDKALVLSHGKEIAIAVAPVPPKAKPKATAAEISEALKPGQKLADMRKLSAPGADVPEFAATGDYKDHPFVKAYAGDGVEPDYDNSIYVPLEHRKKLKAKVATSLSKAIDVPKEEASNFVHHWAESSNDSHASSLTAQRAAAQEFGTSLSKWQLGRYQEALEKARNNFASNWASIKMKFATMDDKMITARAIKDSDTGSLNSLVSFQATAMNKRLEAGDFPKDGVTAKSFFDSTLDDAARKMQQAVRHMHNETLKLFKSWKMDTVRAYRGVELDHVPDEWQTGQTITFTSNALSSWALEPKTAKSTFTSNDPNSVVLEAAVPVERIIATPQTGYGCAQEWEIVILGGSQEGDEAKLRWRSGSYKSAFIKGGEGSGNHGHMGIPGHQGGSQPTGQHTDTAGKKPSGHLSLIDKMVKKPQPKAGEPHPQAPLFAGTTAAVDTAGNLLLSAEQQAATKTAIVSKLSAELGITKQHANSFLKIWADSANDHSLQSIGIQQAAANEFDTFMAYWQQERHNETLAKAKDTFLKAFEKRVAGGMDGGKAAFETINSLKAEYVYPFQIKAARELVEGGALPKTAEEALALFDKSGQMGMERTQQALRVMYNQTQAELAAQGVTSLNLYRGVQFEQGIPENWSMGSQVDIRHNALSSWTTNAKVAADYAQTENGVMLAADVPADRILSVPKTGLGNAGQWEAVVIGQKEREPARVLNPKTYAEATTVAPEAPKANPLVEQMAAKPAATPPAPKPAEAPKPTPVAPNPVAAPKPTPTATVKPATTATPTATVKPAVSAAQAKPAAPVGPLATQQEKYGKMRATEPNHKPDFKPTQSFAKHPLAQHFSDGKIEIDGKKTEALKVAAMKSLAQRANISEEESNQFIANWADSSNDHNLSSLSIQKAAAEEFGGQLSTWQQERFTETLDGHKKQFGMNFLKYSKAKGMDPVAAVRAAAEEQAGTGSSFPFHAEFIEKQLQDGPVPKNALQAQELFERAALASVSKSRKAVRAMHSATQELFNKWGIKEVTAFRGFTTPSKFLWQAGDVIKHESNALSSWSLERETASIFANPDDEDQGAYIVQSRIPASRIVAMPGTGFGCANEWEIVVMGGSKQVEETRVIQGSELFSEPEWDVEDDMSFKGGQGSGNFNHLGIEGHRGGSKPQGLGGGAAAPHGPLPKFSTIGQGKVASATQGGSGLLAPVNLDNVPQVHSALDKFIQGSPALSRAATAKTPLPKSMLTPPAGGKQGDQHLAEVMRATGVDSKLPTKQNLQIGAKSLYMPVSGKDELDEYMEKRLAEKGPRLASSGGSSFFKPHPAKGANAHAQLKPEAKVADKKKVEEARQKVRQETHGLLMSALIEAAKTGDYSQANALELKYQLTNGIETFALLMGYQAINGGAGTDTIVLDRSALNIHPTPILGAHRPAVQTPYPMPHKAQVVKRCQIGKLLPIKGGEGSGNFGHIGRPGHRGGSQPKGDAPPLSNKLMQTKTMREALAEIAQGHTHSLMAGRERYAKHFTDLGIARETFDEMYKLLDAYGGVKSQQAYAIPKILEALQSDSPLGDAFRLQVQTETALMQALLDNEPKHNEQLIARMAEDWDWEKRLNSHADEIQVGGEYWDANDREGFLATQRKILERDPFTLYRKGSLDQPIQSWSQNSRGAWMGNAGHIGVDHSMTYKDVLDQYYVLGGFAKMMGAPGESEVTLIRIDALIR